MIATLPAFSLERQCRRRRWSAGYPIRLADASIWLVPSIEAGELADDPGLATDLREAFAIARTPRTPGETGDENIEALCRFHARLAVIAIRLLRYNYDLPDYSWEGLLLCDDVGDTLQLAAALSFAIEHAVAGLTIAS